MCATCLAGRPILWVALVRLLAWIMTLAACAALAVWLAMLARLMRMRRYMWHFLIVAMALAAMALLGCSELSGILLARENGVWLGMVMQANVGLLPGPLLLWLLGLCVAWGRVLHKENVALGLAK